MNKKRMYNFAEKHVNKSNTQIVILFIPLLIVIVSQVKKGEFSWDSILDTSILVSFFIVFICEMIAQIIITAVTKKCEDAAKLEENYDKLISKYCRVNLVKHINTVENTEEKFPVEELFSRTEKQSAFTIKIDNLKKTERYVLPSQIKLRSDYLMKAHRQSFLYNNINIRLNDICLQDNTVKMTCSITSYFDSMITNRAMDFQWENGKTNREVYEPGPFISELSNSKLSNHLGFNGFIETSDNKIIFVQRCNNLSIGKGTLADSIGASLKAKYACDENVNLTEEGLYAAMSSEIKDELKINVDPSELKNSIFSFYRDLVEGGKPQFLFYYKTNSFTAEKFDKNFKDNYKKKDKRAITDGSKFYYYSLEQLRNAIIKPNLLELKDGSKKIQHAMMPSASAAIVMLLRYKSESACNKTT